MPEVVIGGASCLYSPHARRLGRALEVVMLGGEKGSGFPAQLGHVGDESACKRRSLPSGNKLSELDGTLRAVKNDGARVEMYSSFRPILR